MAGRDLFASTTGDTDYGLFFTPRDMAMFNDYNTELLEIIAKTKVKYRKERNKYTKVRHKVNLKVQIEVSKQNETQHLQKTNLRTFGV